MNTTPPVHEARQHVLTATRAYLCGADVAPRYLAAGPDRAATALLGAAAARISAAGYGERLLVCTGQDFARFWQDTLRRGMTPFIRRALATRRAILLTGLEALQEEPFAQAELARLVAPPRLVNLAGRLHLRHVTAWTPALGACLQSATTLCLHAGPCVGEADAWEIVDAVATYYGLTRRLLLSPCRTAPVAQARQVAMYLLREQGLSYSTVGRLLRRDHATVLYGCARIRQISLQRPDLHHDLDTLRRYTCAA
jgi:hypothetical protein